MLRPIKFRAWDDEIKHMYYPPNHHIFVGCDGKAVNFQNGVMLIPLFWTGRLDKNGKEIWESDIYKTINNEVGKIVFSIGAFWVEYFWPHDWDPMCPAELIHGDGEVLGNIYENPDLLK